jgi:hypothetical protein
MLRVVVGSGVKVAVGGNQIGVVVGVTVGGSGVGVSVGGSGIEAGRQAERINSKRPAVSRGRSRRAFLEADGTGNTDRYQLRIYRWS